MNPISRDRFLSAPVTLGDGVVRTVRDFEEDPSPPYSEERIRNRLIYYYRYVLTEEHEKVTSMLDLVGGCRTPGIRVLLYATPINVGAADRRLGEAFRSTVSRNVGLLGDLLDRRGVLFLDLSFALDEDGFNRKESGYPNEHLVERGWRLIADRLASVLQAP